jgi:glycosyltransferase involved in cell wall biosynthesis
MRICFIHNLYKPFEKGGAENMVESLVSDLIKRGHNIFLITTKPYFTKYKDKETDNIENELTVNRISSLYFYLNKMPKFLRLIWHILHLINFINYFKIKRILKEIEPDIVFTHNLIGLGFMTACTINKLGYKYIHTLHDIQLLHPSGLLIHKEENKIDSLLAKIYQIFTSKLFTNVDYVISPSKWLLDLHVSKNFFRNSEKKIIRNPVTTPVKNTVGNSVKNYKVFKFIYIGQMEEHKGILFLYTNINSFLQNSINISLDIIGDGKLKKELESRNNNKNIHFHGYLPNKQARNLLAESNCLIVPSICYENSPMVIYEALSLHIPVIGSKIGGIIELFKNNQKYLFKPGDEKDFYEKLNLIMKENNFNFEINLNSIDNYINKISNFFK